MKIEILEFVEGATKAKGLAVIVDVFRAFSVACYAYEAGAARIIATSGVENAFLLKQTHKNSVLIGEREEKKIDGFDYGNSPTEIITSDLKGKTIIHTTTAGTQGLVNALNADSVITGSFVNMGAIVRYIKTIDPSEVSLVAMGYRASVSADEDLLCCEGIAAELNNKTPVSDLRIAQLQYTSGKRFFNRDNFNYSPPTDFFLCTMKNRFNFVLKAEKRADGNIELLKMEV